MYVSVLCELNANDVRFFLENLEYFIFNAFLKFQMKIFILCHFPLIILDQVTVERKQFWIFK